MIPISVKQAIEKAKTDRDFATQRLGTRRTFIKMSAQEFKDILILKSERIFLNRSEPKQYRFDDFNKPIINHLYYYAIGSDKFSGDINKGIHMWGDYGAGKSTLMQAFTEIISENTGKNIMLIESKSFASLILHHGIEYFISRPILLDDIGRETKEIKNFGNIINPVPDIYYLRKERGTWTFQTCQRPIADLESIYGKFITDRMTAMFNEVHFKGTSRR